MQQKFEESSNATKERFNRDDVLFFNVTIELITFYVGGMFLLKRSNANGLVTFGSHVFH